MIPILAALDFNNLAIGAIIGAIIGYFSGAANNSFRLEFQLVEQQLRVLQQKLDTLMKHQGVELPPPSASGLSPEVERLASIPDGKIAAIKLYRQEHPGVGLAEAKTRIEEFYRSRS
jgi:hypothetical protein